MDSKIQELAEKVYNEGVLKANAEAERIISEAEARAKSIISEAERNADELVRGAERRANEQKLNSERELQLYANQLVEATRSSLVAHLAGTIASDNVQALGVNPEFIQQFMLELVKGFDLNKGVEITGAHAEQLAAYFNANARHLMEQGVSIKQVAGKPTDFTLRPSDGGFKLHIGEAEFVELFKSFVRPQLASQLF